MNVRIGVAEGERPASKGREHRMTQTVGRMVERYRKRQNLTVQQLARLVWPDAKAGSRMRISNLEGGQREGVTLAEVMRLAAALDVPPLALIFPVGVESEVELPDGRTVNTGRAMRWFIGEAPLPDAGEREWDPRGIPQTIGWTLVH